VEWLLSFGLTQVIGSGLILAAVGWFVASFALPWARDRNLNGLVALFEQIDTPEERAKILEKIRKLKSPAVPSTQTELLKQLIASGDKETQDLLAEMLKTRIEKQGADANKD